MTRAFSTLRSGSGDGAPAAISQAVRQAGRFDSSAVSLRDGLVAAIPVVVLLAAGTAAGDPVAAVTMGAGAMLVGVAWRAGGGRPPLAAMATTTAVMGLSTFAGAASCQYAWLHFAIVAVWSFVAGLLVALGPRGGTVGLQAIIAIIVFGRFPQPLGVESGDAAAARRLGSTGSGLIEPRDAVVAAAEHDHAVLAARIAEHAAALAGQVRAVVGLAVAAPWNQRGRLPGGRNDPGRPGPRRGRGLSGALERLREGVDQVRANASLQSAAGRHAVRLAVVVAVTELLARHLPIQRSYWMVVAAAAVLKPEFGATFTRGADRVLGTCVGALVAGLLIVGVHPSGWATVGLVGLLAWGAYAIFPASFAAGVAFLTGMIVFLLNVVTADTLATAVARGLDTIIGGAIGLLAYAVWPTWSRVPARAALAQLVGAQRSYLKAVLDPLVKGVTFPESTVSSAARRARLAWTNAEATVTRSAHGTDDSTKSSTRRTPSANWSGSSRSSTHDPVAGSAL